MMRTRSLIACAAAVALPVVASAQETRLSADVSTTLGYSNNPFSVVGNDTGSAFAELNVRPQLQILTARSVFTINAAAQVEQYFKHYSTSDSYQAILDYRGRPTEHLTTHFDASFLSSIVGSFNNFAGSVVDPAQTIGFGRGATPGIGSVVTTPVSATTLPVYSGTDVALFGTRSRQRTINVGGDVTAALSARDQLTGSLFFIDSRYSQTSAFGNLNNYNGYGSSLGYARQVSSFTQLGLQGSAARYIYKGAGSHSNVFSLQATLSGKLNAYWSLSGAAGLSLVDRTGQGSSTAFSGNLSLCRTGVRTTACLTARRAVLPTGILGTQNETDVGGTYRYRLSEHATLGLTANYTKNVTPYAIQTNGNEYVLGAISYERQLRQRLRFISTARYREVFGSNFKRAADFGGQVGLSLRLGDIR